MEKLILFLSILFPYKKGERQYSAQAHTESLIYTVIKRDFYDKDWIPHKSEREGNLKAVRNLIYQCFYCSLSKNSIWYEKMCT